MAMLARAFFLQPTQDVARQLLGKRLVRILPTGQRLSGVIVETEAYLGEQDAAAHTFGGRQTPRVSSMYKQGGTVYIYFIYGKHHCLNVVTGAVGIGEAVLIRALQPVNGIEIMQEHRGQVNMVLLANGPGKICQALQLNRSFDGEDLLGDRIFIEDSTDGSTDDFTTAISRPIQIIIGPRIGIGKANPARAWPLRFSIAGNRFVSSPRPIPGRAREG